MEPIIGYPALMVTNQRRILVLSDLHLGWEHYLSEKGIHIPSQTQLILNKIKNLIEITDPDLILLLGDIKHSIEKTSSEEWIEVPKFFQNIKKLVDKIEIIPGNFRSIPEPFTSFIVIEANN